MLFETGPWKLSVSSRTRMYHHTARPLDISTCHWWCPGRPDEYAHCGNNFFLPDRGAWLALLNNTGNSAVGKKMWFDIPPQRTADAGRNSTQTVSHAPQSEANALHRRAAEQLPPRSRRQSDPSALNVSQQSADSLRPYALRTRATAGAARTASAARAPHAASQHVAASQACVRGGAKVWLQHFFSAEQHVGLARAVARGTATAGLPRSVTTRKSIDIVVKSSY